MPSTLKRPSLCRLLASLRPSSGGTSPSFPVQTGFPTSLADIVVKNHGRLRKPRKPRCRASAPTSPPGALTVEAHNEITPPPPPPPAQPLSPVLVQRLDSASRQEGGAVFRLRPEVLVFGGAVALALLAVWSEGTVAAFTVAALSLLWIESASRRRGHRCPAEAEALLDSCGRGPVSPIREVAVEAPRSSCSDSDKGDDLVAGSGSSEDPTTPRLKARRSLKKLISKKLQKKPKSKNSWSTCDGEASQPETDAGDPALKTESSFPFSAEQTPSESSMEWSSSSSSSESVVHGRGGIKIPLAALAPVILAGLAVGKLPATVLAVLCLVFSSTVQRL